MRKNNKIVHLPLYLNNATVKLTHTQKHLGLQLDSKLSFNVHTKLKLILPRRSLLIIYKSFIRSHLDYGDVIYDQLSNALFSNKVESVQYNAALAITEAIKGASRDKLNQELELEYLQQRRWMRRFCLLYKFLSTGQTSYILKLLPQMGNSYGHPNTFVVLPCRTEYLKKIVFRMSLMNRINLIKTFAALVITIFFVMHF